jgi:hypothetical protein
MVKDKPGLLGIVAPFLGRYREFPMSIDRLRCPEGTGMNMYYGVSKTDYCNMMIRYLLEHQEYSWLWIISDGFVFRPDLVENLLERDVDVVVPQTLYDEYPYAPRLCEDKAGNYADVSKGWLQGKTGMVKLTDKTCRPEGMLIKREVFEQLEDPWFVNGMTRSEECGSGIWFCQQLHEHGIGLYLDLDNSMGTITHVGIKARRCEDGTYEKAVNVSLYNRS